MRKITTYEWVMLFLAAVAALAAVAQYFEQSQYLPVGLKVAVAVLLPLAQLAISAFLLLTFFQVRALRQSVDRLAGIGARLSTVEEERKAEQGLRFNGSYARLGDREFTLGEGAADYYLSLTDPDRELIHRAIRRGWVNVWRWERNDFVKVVDPKQRVKLVLDEHIGEADRILRRIKNVIWRAANPLPSGGLLEAIASGDTDRITVLDDMESWRQRCSDYLKSEGSAYAAEFGSHVQIKETGDLFEEAVLTLTVLIERLRDIKAKS